MNLTYRWRLLLALLLGGISALGQAPFDLPLIMFAAFAGAAWLFATELCWRRAAIIGWLYGAGYFAVSLHWIVQPFLVDVARHGWMAPFALLLMAAGLALFWGVAFGLARWLSRGSWGLAVTLPAVEMLRAYVFTGFPWAMFVQGLVDSLAGQGLALFGPYGLTVVFVLLALAALNGPAILRVGALCVAGGLILAPPPVDIISDDAKVVRLVQPNAAQHEKWDPDKIAMFFNRQLSFSVDGLRPDLIIWPETAIPWALERAEPVLIHIASAARGAPVLLGVQRSEDGLYYNSLASLDQNGDLSSVYDKHHLVPFGEYFPMGDLLGMVGLAEAIGGGYSAGPGAELIDVVGIGPVLPLICYEAVFAHDVHAAPSRPVLIAQVTNDAWFGPAAGPWQHLAQARMRAIEQGVPVARSANTGVSAMIGPRGQIIAHLPLNEAGFLDAPLPEALSATPYARIKDWPLAILFIAFLAGAGWRRARNTD